MNLSTHRAVAHPAPIWPEGEETPHPRAAELASTLLDLQAVNPGVSFKDLIGAGFTAAEITEHMRAAEKIASGQATRQVSFSADRMADVLAKVRAPMPNAPLTAPGGDATPAISQAQFQAWGRYCAARSAYLLDPNFGQRERCLNLLSDYLATMPFFPRDRTTILRAAGQALQQAGH